MMPVSTATYLRDSESQELLLSPLERTIAPNRQVSAMDDRWMMVQQEEDQWSMMVVGN